MIVYEDNLHVYKVSICYVYHPKTFGRWVHSGVEPGGVQKVPCNPPPMSDRLLCEDNYVVLCSMMVQENNHSNSYDQRYQDLSWE